MNTLSKRLRRYGLRYDDLYDPKYDLDINEALNRLPREVVDARTQRLRRAIDLSMKHDYLPDDLQAMQTPFRSYLQEMLALSFNGEKWEKFNSEKVAALAYARIQGKAALIDHFQNSSLMNEDKGCRPIIFCTDGPNAGKQEPFPLGAHIRVKGGKTRGSVYEDNRHCPGALQLLPTLQSPIKEVFHQSRSLANRRYFVTLFYCFFKYITSPFEIGSVIISPHHLSRGTGFNSMYQVI